MSIKILDEQQITCILHASVMMSTTLRFPSHCQLWFETADIDWQVRCWSTVNIVMWVCTWLIVIHYGDINWQSHCRVIFCNSACFYTLVETYIAVCFAMSEFFFWPGQDPPPLPPVTEFCSDTPLIFAFHFVSWNIFERLASMISPRVVMVIILKWLFYRVTCRKE